MTAAIQLEVALTAIKNADTGETADFCGKRTALDAEEIGELLAVERNVEFCLSALFGNRAEVGHNAVFRRAMRKDFYLRIQFERLGGNDAHDVSHQPRMKSAGVAARRTDPCGV